MTGSDLSGEEEEFLRLLKLNRAPKSFEVSLRTVLVILCDKMVDVTTKKTQLYPNTSQMLPSHSKLPNRPRRLNLVIPSVLESRGSAELSINSSALLAIICRMCACR